MDDGGRSFLAVIIILLFLAALFRDGRNGLRVRFRSNSRRVWTGRRQGKKSPVDTGEFRQSDNNDTYRHQYRTHCDRGNGYGVRDAQLGNFGHYGEHHINDDCGVLHRGDASEKHREEIQRAAGVVNRRFAVLFHGRFQPAGSGADGHRQAAAKLTRGDPAVSVTEDELYDIIEDMTDEGSLDTERGDLVSSALQFAEVTAGTVLTSRVDLAAVNVDWGEEELMAFIKEQRHSRLRCTRARWTISSACSRSANT